MINYLLHQENSGIDVLPDIRCTPFMEISSFSIWERGEQSAETHAYSSFFFPNILLYRKML